MAGTGGSSSIRCDLVKFYFYNSILSSHACRTTGQQQRGYDLWGWCQQCDLALYVSMQNGISSVWLLSHVQLFVTPWTAAHQASLSITNSQSLLKLMSTESVMPSNHLILCHRKQSQCQQQLDS